MLQLRNYWYIALRSSELKASPQRRFVEGEPLVFFRDESGAPRALVDRCLHRGAKLSEGKVQKGCVVCPYHGWAFDGEGSLCDVPSLGVDQCLPKAKAKSYPVEEKEGHIWVWLGRDEPSFEAPHFPMVSEGAKAEGWSSFFMYTQFEAASVEACLENFLDVPHTLHVHPGLFRSKGLKETKVQIRGRSDGVEVEYIDENPLSGIGPKLLLPRGARMTHVDRFILPSMTRVDYTFGENHSFIITSQCTHREENIIDVTTAISWKLPAPRWVVAPFLRWYCRHVILQDVEILKNHCEQEMRFGRTFMNTTADLLGPLIHKLRREAAEGVVRMGNQNDELLSGAKASGGPASESSECKVLQETSIKI